MRPECSHILPNHHKCHGLALRGHQRCFHHIDPAQRPPLRPLRDPFSRITRWRQLGRRVHTLPVHEIPCNVYSVLGGLFNDGQDGISDREAGRLLRILLRRHGSIPALPPPEVLIEAPFTQPAKPSAVSATTPNIHSAPNPSGRQQGIDPELLDFLESQVDDPDLIRRIRAQYTA